MWHVCLHTLDRWMHDASTGNQAGRHSCRPLEASLQKLKAQALGDANLRSASCLVCRDGHRRAAQRAAAAALAGAQAATPHQAACGGWGGRRRRPRCHPGQPRGACTTRPARPSRLEQLTGPAPCPAGAQEAGNLTAAAAAAAPLAAAAVPAPAAFATAAMRYACRQQRAQACHFDAPVGRCLVGPACRVHRRAKQPPWSNQVTRGWMQKNHAPGLEHARAWAV